jgi:hypothetical protein
MTTSSERWPADPRYAAVAREVLGTCRAMTISTAVASPLYRLVPGGATTCYGIVEHLDGRLRFTLVVGRLVAGAVDVMRVPIAGARVIEALALAERQEDEPGRSCSCGHDLPAESVREGLDYQCPACRFWPLRPFGWRGPLPERDAEGR